MIEIDVAEEAWSALPDVEALVVRAAEAALIAPYPQRAAVWAEQDLCVLLTGDEGVQDLNARFRGKDAPTNVLSFPAAATAAPHLGDVALAYGVCAREAAAQGKPLADHLSHLVVHATLHLLGYDHTADAEAEAMEAMERRILARLGVEDPYRSDEDRG